MFEQEYQLEFFLSNGFVRKVCKACGTPFWTLDQETELCGDTPCVDYGFINEPLIQKKHDIASMRESFLSFFEGKGHTRLNRYPVVARWRADIYLTIASIADFQPHVTSGEVPPPANPLCVSQPCIRLADIDAIGKSGRHLTNFEMMGHHAFSKPGNLIYWKDEAIGYAHEFFSKEHGIPEEKLIYREDPWTGGGNAGPAMEIMAEGLEVATMVFMCMKETDGGEYEIKGRTYSPMDMKVVDPGYGLERIVWASRGSPTLYDAIYPHIIDPIFEETGLTAELDKPGIHEFRTEYAKLCGIMDFGTFDTLSKMRQYLAEQMQKRGYDWDAGKLHDFMTPLENVYTVVDHARCLGFMLGDGIVPSNVKAGYLVRLVLRRAIRLLQDIKTDLTLQDLVAQQIDSFPEYPELKEAKDTIMDVLEKEEERYHNTLSKGSRLIETMVAKKDDKQIVVDDLVDLYDTHGLHPSIVEKVATGLGASVDIPDNFNTIVAEMHLEEKREKAEDEVKIPVPETNLMFYTHPMQREFDSPVLYCKDKQIALAETLFYPEGGGQACDLGVLITPTETVNVVDVQKHHGVVVHICDKDIPVGEIVHGVVDWERREAHYRHHTATHIILGSARKVLGEHVWQAGAKKTHEFGRLDITHYDRISVEQLQEIERVANSTVLKGIQVEKSWMDRQEAEKKYGFRLYEGGIPPGKQLRIVRISDFDVEACAGTHADHTNDLGLIKIVNCERIQDGVERLEFTAGLASLNYIQGRESILTDACDVVSVTPEQLPKTMNRFFTEWKGQQKEIESLRKEMAEAASCVGDAPVTVGEVTMLAAQKNFDMKGLISYAQGVIKNDKTVVVVASAGDGTRASFLVARSADVDLHCGEVMREATAAIGGKGGGKPDFAQGGSPDVGTVDKWLEAAKAEITKRLS